MNRFGNILLYCIFALVAVVVFLYILFPSDLAQQILAQRIDDLQTDLEIETGQIDPTFPPGFKLVPLIFGYNGMDIVRLEHFKVAPNLISLLGSQKEFNFKGIMDAGTFKGHAQMIADDKRPQTKINMNLTHVPVDALEILKQWPQYKLAGELNAHFDYDSRKGAGGTGKTTLDINGGRITFDPPLMNLEQLEFSQIKAEMTITPRMLQIRRCEAEGPQINSKISGSIIFRQPLSNSRITLSCTIKPQPAFLADHKSDMLGGLLTTKKSQRGMVFRISGTLDNPRYVIR